MSEKVKIDPNKVIKVPPKLIKSDFSKQVKAVEDSIKDAFTLKGHKGRLLIPELDEITIAEAKYLIDYAVKLSEFVQSNTKQ